MKLCTSCHHGLQGAPAHCPLCGVGLAALPEITGDRLVGMRVAEHYVLAELVGEGAMGWVYRGVHQGLDRSVAIKLLKVGGDEDAVAVARFDQEARAVSRIHHPHIVSIIDYGRTPGGLLYLATEFLEGGTLADLLAVEGLLSVNRVLAIFHQVLAAVEEAHFAHVVHRDLKPDNIVVTSLRSGGDFVKVLDFGIAALADEASEQSVYAGTPGFMAPEMINHGVADTRSDIYALGAIVFEMLTGRPPFQDPNPLALLSMHASDAPPTLASAAPDRSLPQQMEQAVARALAKDPATRYASVADLRADLLAAFACMGTEQAGCEECARPRDPISGLCDLHGGTAQHTPFPPASGSRVDASSRTLLGIQAPDDDTLVERLLGAGRGCLPEDAAAIVDFLLGDAKLLEVVGPVGFNRERIVDGAAFVAGLLDMRLLRLRPDHRGALRPWYPVRRMVGEILGCGADPASPTTLYGAARQLLERRHTVGISLLYGFSSSEAPAGRRDRHAAILRAVNALLRAGQGDHAGVCVLVDEVSEFDRSSQRFVRQLETTAQAPLVKILSNSETRFWPQEEGRQLLRPHRFDVDAVGALLDRTDLRGDVDKRALAARIAAVADGLPFHAEQAIAVFREGGDFTRPLRDLIGWRLQHLPADAVEVLRVICALGDDVDLTILNALVDDDVGMLAVDMLIRAGLLESSAERSLSPSRPALRRAVLEQVSTRDRIDLHRRIFAALDRMASSPFVLAHHAFEGEMDEVAFTLLEQAGDRACTSSDEETAAQVHYRHAVHVARWRMLMGEGDSRYLSLSLKLGEVLLDTGHLRAAEVTFKEVLGNADPNGDLAIRARAGLDRLDGPQSALAPVPADIGPS